MNAALPEPQRIRLGQRARSVPFKRQYVEALVVTALFYLCVTGSVTALFASLALRTAGNALILGGFAATTSLFWLLSFLKRRSAKCPLCQGTPLVDSAARKHMDAKRFFPLNYGTSNSLRCIFHQKYHCPYCGTPFDLLKKADFQSRGC